MDRVEATGAESTSGSASGGGDPIGGGRKSIRIRSMNHGNRTDQGYRRTLPNATIGTRRQYIPDTHAKIAGISKSSAAVSAARIR
jgi:hypothetical protein